jgi:hypothetical protein
MAALSSCSKALTFAQACCSREGRREGVREREREKGHELTNMVGWR